MTLSESTSVLPRNIPPISSNEVKFLVVGIGASAGGLAALSTLFEHMPSSSGMAFVIVLHLSPTHDSAADVILQRKTAMPVIQVVERTAILPNQIYVIAPNRNLNMSEGHLDVSMLDRPVGAHTAIDVFFTTLAEIHRERAVAIVLSGTGADGSVGLARIKEQGGLTLAQSPADAEYEGMPQAAILTGMVDFILPVTEMAQKLIELNNNARLIMLPRLDGDTGSYDGRMSPAEHAQAEEAMHKVIELLRIRTGHDFRHYKRATVLRRIERRLQVRAVPTLPAYRALLESDPAEPRALLQDMLIGVTSFFRDREAFDTLERDIVQDLCKVKSEAGETIRVWITACSTGEEAYSLAMMFEDIAANLMPPPPVQLFASDINENAIATARTGMYPASIVADVTPVRLRQYFVKLDHHYQIKKTIRDKVLFAAHNLLRDPPFSKVDLISCRNLLIYLDRSVQVQVLEMFHFALNPGGILFLGSSESAESVADFFEPVDKKSRLYRARKLPKSARYTPSLSRPTTLRVPEIETSKIAGKARLAYAEVHQRILLQSAAPSVVLSRDDNILHMSDLAGKYLRHVGGEPSRNALSLVLPALRLELRSGLIRAKSSNALIETAGVALQRDGKISVVRMVIQPFRDEEAAVDFLLVLFIETDAGDSISPANSLGEDATVIAQLEDELQRTRDQLIETVEHGETSTEELRASNEELQAINEELRSTTEELEISKEELQSINEELLTVNYEMKMKVEETSKVNDDLNNLIASTDIATIFVDKAMRIKRFTPRVTDIFNIISADVGRSLFDITHKLDYQQLADDAASTFTTLQPVEREVQQSDGRSYIVRFQPYRTVNDRIDGAVLTFFDITSRRIAEEKMFLSEAGMRLVAESTHDYGIMTLDHNGKVTSWNAGAQRIYGYTETEMIGKSAECLFTAADRNAGVPADEMRRASEVGRAEDERWHLRKDGSSFYWSGVTTPIGTGPLCGYAKIGRDQTARKNEHESNVQALDDEKGERVRAEDSNATKDEFLAVMSHELRHPLNLIHINIELLSRRAEVRDSAISAKSISVVQSAVIAQAKIIDDLLDMSRLNTGKLTLSQTDIDLAATVTALVETFRADPATTTLSLQAHGCNSPVMVRADAVRIEQVIMNLLGNAVKFTPAGAITVTLSQEPEQEQVRLDVRDTGQGIAPSFLPHVFELYGQSVAVTARSRTGLGIGLALVKQIVELHGGRVEAHSDGIGQGSQFSIWLPLSHATIFQRNAAPPSLDGTLAGVRLLLVDDSEDMVLSVQALLEMAGATAYVATSGKAALALLQTTAIDLVVSDINMPDMDGYALVQAIRRHPPHRTLPVIAVSGLDRQRDVEQGKSAGFDAHIRKPMAIDGLIETVKRLLAERAGKP